MQAMVKSLKNRQGTRLLLQGKILKDKVIDEQFFHMVTSLNARCLHTHTKEKF